MPLQKPTKQLTWGELRQKGEGLPDDAPVFIEDGKYDILVAVNAAGVRTHQEAAPWRGHAPLYEEQDLLLEGVEARELPVPAFVLSFDGVFDLDDVVIPSIA